MSTAVQLPAPRFGVEVHLKTNRVCEKPHPGVKTEADGRQGRSGSYGQPEQEAPTSGRPGKAWGGAHAEELLPQRGPQPTG